MLFPLFDWTLLLIGTLLSGSGSEKHENQEDSRKMNEEDVN